MINQKQYLHQRLNGLSGGVLWGLDTVLIGVILMLSPLKAFTATAPLLATAIHDLFSTIILLVLGIFKSGGSYLTTLFKSLFQQSSGRWVAFAALFGGPIGMTGYTLSIHYIGPGYTAVISAMYPAFGALLNFAIFRHRINLSTIIGLVLAIGGTMLTGISASIGGKVNPVGLIFSILCVVGWGSESVISAYGMKNDLDADTALQIRQLVSAFVFLCFIIPFVPAGLKNAATILSSPAALLLLVTAFAGTLSYRFYYRSINTLGAIQAMGLNISYSAWAIIIGLFFGTPLSWTTLFLALLIVLGSVLTADSEQFILHKLINFRQI